MTDSQHPLVGIMQPTYLPWLGYMAMLDGADTFVFLDTVQFDKRSWQQRNRVKTPNGPAWLTVPVLSKGALKQDISAVAIDITRNFANKHIATLQANYAKAKFFDDMADNLFPVLSAEHERLSDLNIALIEKISLWLGIETKLMRASDLKDEGHKADRLAVIAEDVGAKTYVAAPGSLGYLSQSDSFDKRAIDVRYLDYQHPEYKQRFGDFVSNLSIVDALCNAGAERTLDMMREGMRLVDQAHLEHHATS